MAFALDTRDGHGVVLRDPCWAPLGEPPRDPTMLEALPRDDLDRRSIRACMTHGAAVAIGRAMIKQQDRIDSLQARLEESERRLAEETAKRRANQETFNRVLALAKASEHFVQQCWDHKEWNNDEALYHMRVYAENWLRARALKRERDPCDEHAVDQ